MILKDRVAVVAGGSAGIGKAICKVFAREGAKVVVSARNQRRLGEALNEIRRIGEAIAVEADVRQEADVQRLFDATAATYGQVDILAVPAGAGGRVVNPVAELSLDDWNAVFATNMVGTFLCCREALKHMIPAKRGAIVTFSSEAADRGNEYRSAYSAAKAAVITFTRSLAREVGRYNIRANCLVPGAVSTKALEGGLRARAEKQGIPYEQVRQQLVSAHALQRMATPEEAAEEVLFLVSDAASALTGQALDVSCGSTFR